MIIHTVRTGESPFDISRKYSVPVTKLLADNKTSDRLADGEELVVIMPTRTAIVGGSDTRKTIAKRYGIKESALIGANPDIITRGLRPGQIVAVKQENLGLGAATAVGCTKYPYSTENLIRALPYLTYVTLMAFEIRERELVSLCDPAQLSAICKREGKQLLLGVCDTGCGEFIESRESIILGLKDACRRYGADGVFLYAKEASLRLPEQYCELILNMRKSFIGSELLLFTALYDGMPPDAAELSDGAVTITSKCELTDELLSLSQLSDRAESSKIFVRLNTAASLGDKHVSLAEISELCYRRSMKIVRDGNFICHVPYKQYRHGIGESFDLSFPSLEYTKAKLIKLSELGYAGIYIDIDYLDIRRLTMFNAAFVRADYELTYRYISSL